MRRHPSPTLIELLRSTLERIERHSDPEDESVHNLERSVLRTIAEVQRCRDNRGDSGDQAA